MMGLFYDTRKMISDINQSSFLFGLWGAALNIPQIIGGLAFITRYEAFLILIACVASVVVAAQIHKRSPFNRLTSLVHILWLPLFPLLVQTLVIEGVQEPFGIWLAYVVITMAISLILDARNIILYLFTQDSEFHGARP